ncbi:phosphotransferase family protein [Algicola sagamiensis]|uniref:phosphotransferase family protein n=1 Tax=Algicola sagamiensis TaxID=163869 RepID=UPI000366078E|nr:aminoglycoside phosphotransferase family protein [Algicola sagamiensis]
MDNQFEILSDAQLPSNPSYEQACVFVDHKETQDWLPVLQRILRVHDWEYQSVKVLRDGANIVADIDGKFVLKIVPPNWNEQGLKEIECLSFLRNSSGKIPTPALLFFGELNQWTYICMTQLEGEGLWDIWSELNEEEQCQLAYQTGQFAQSLHQTSITKTFSFEQDWHTFLAQQRQGCYANRKRQGLKENLLEQIPSFIEKYTGESPESKYYLMHTDLHPGNLMGRRTSQGWELSGVIDFGDAVMGADIRFDFATSGIFMALGNASVFRAFLAGYGFTVLNHRDFQYHLMALSLLRHTGELNFLLSHVPGCDQLGTWEDIAQVFFPLD